MFLKLFRNDLKAIFKYWWLGALISVAVSSVGGFPLRVLLNSYNYSDVLNTISFLGVMLVFGSIAAFSLLTTILVFIRYYKNFFSDEGYLTFTLPVKRNQLLMSKFLSAIVTYAATSALIVAEVSTMVFVACADDRDFWRGVADMIVETPSFVSEYWLYIIEAVTLAAVMALFAILLLITCVTFASVIAKKAKVFAAIGIYYGVTSIVATILQVIYFFGGFWFFSWVAELTEDIAGNLIALLLFVLILFIAMFCVIMYTLSLWMIDKKLNLS